MTCSGLAGNGEHALRFGTSFLLDVGDIDISDKGGWLYDLDGRIVPGSGMTSITDERLHASFVGPELCRLASLGARLTSQVSIAASLATADPTLVLESVKTQEDAKLSRSNVNACSHRLDQ